MICAGEILARKPPEIDSTARGIALNGIMALLCGQGCFCERNRSESIGERHGE